MTVFDLDKVTTESTNDQPFTFTFGGHEFVCPGTVMDMRIVNRMTDGEVGAALRLLVGDTNYDILDGLNEPFTVAQMGALYEAWAAHFGIDPKESRATSPSSKPTAKR